MKPFLPALALLASLLPRPALGGDRVVVGSKIFTESYILGEIAAQIIEGSSRVQVDRKLGMGSTGLLFESLKSGAIDVYPDYSGTLAESILKDPRLQDLGEIRTALTPLGLTISGPLGFKNTYALAVTESFARKHGLRSISDLQRIAPITRAAFSYEFMDRQDGYRGLARRYRLGFDPKKVRRMEHSLVYRAISEDAVDIIEVYSTDANIPKFHLRLLEDDKGYFPPYQAVWVARKSFVRQHPSEWERLLRYEGTIHESEMQTMNASADIDKESFQDIAARFLGAESARPGSPLDQVLPRTREHLWLVGIALLFSVAVGIPLGIVAARFHFVGQGILLFSALVQTVPTLALLCFLIPVFGVGAKPAVVALCLYGLLPVVLNTYTGIRAVDGMHIENAKAFGLTRMQILMRVVLPIASPGILAGVKTAAIVSIGTATLAALIGAGGYGALIVTGLALNNMTTILTGAIPAGVMAIVAHVSFGIVERFVIPKGLR